MKMSSDNLAEKIYNHSIKYLDDQLCKWISEMENNPFFLIITIYLLELGSSECAENFFALAYDKECRLFHGLEFNELISVLESLFTNPICKTKQTLRTSSYKDLAMIAIRYIFSKFQGRILE